MLRFPCGISCHLIKVQYFCDHLSPANPLHGHHLTPVKPRNQCMARVKTLDPTHSKSLNLTDKMTLSLTTTCRLCPLPRASSVCFGNILPSSTSWVSALVPLAPSLAITLVSVLYGNICVCVMMAPSLVKVRVILLYCNACVCDDGALFGYSTGETALL